MKRKTAKFNLFLIAVIFQLTHCNLLPTGSIEVLSITPAANTKITSSTPFSVTLKYSIDNYDNSLSYNIDYMLYDTVNNWYQTGSLGNISSSSGNVTLSFTGSIFYNCFNLSCFRATPLPFRLYFALNTKKAVDFAKTKEYLYTD